MRKKEHSTAQNKCIQNKNEHTNWRYACNMFARRRRLSQVACVNWSNEFFQNKSKISCKWMWFGLIHWANRILIFTHGGAHNCCYAVNSFNHRRRFKEITHAIWWPDIHIHISNNDFIESNASVVVSVLLHCEKRTNIFFNNIKITCSPRWPIHSSNGSLIKCNIQMLKQTKFYYYETICYALNEGKWFGFLTAGRCLYL